jgi:pyruvate dehydrogenase E2 component (dihydrolipoamide acetyltransferase)
MTPGRVNREWLRRGQGAPIVFVHGFGADINGWRPVQLLLPETRAAFAVDLPGHGRTPLGEDASFDALVEAVRGVLIEEDLREVHLVGHSLGAAVVTALTRAPEIAVLSLMLLAPAGLGAETNAAFVTGFLQAANEAELTPWLESLVRDPAALGSTLARTTLRQRATTPILSAQKRLAEALFVDGRQAFSVRELLAAPAMPVKVVIGTQDAIVPANHVEDLSGLIALHRLQQVGHLPHFEARREVARLIEELARSGQGEA